MLAGRGGANILSAYEEVMPGRVEKPVLVVPVVEFV